MKYNYVKDLMTSPAIVKDENCTIEEAIKTLQEKDIGFLPITKGNVLIGVVTDRDILLRTFGKYNPNNKIATVLTSGEVHFVSPSTPLIDAAKMMAAHKVRRLVVVNDGKVVGVITSKNIIKETSLLPYILETYNNSKTLNPYSIYLNSNPHDSIKSSDFPL